MSTRISRRQFLTLAGAALATLFGLPRRTWARDPVGAPIRIGVILPLRSGPEMRSTSPHDVVANAARMGAVMGGDEVGANAALLGMKLDVLLASSPDADAATRAAERLVATEDACALVGGFGEDQALAISKVAAARRVPFFNIGTPEDALRGESCNRYTFHVEASAAMYLEALAGWFVRAGHRRWFLVYDATPAGEALYRRFIRGVTANHWGAGEVGKAAIAPGQPTYNKEIQAIQKARPDVVLLLTGAQAQLSFCGQYEAAGIDARITGFPHPPAQTREFYNSLRQAAPKSGAGYRAMLWETTLDAYGARELNNRFMTRWGQPMDPAAWSAYQAIKIAYETAFGAMSLAGADMVAHLEQPATVFDVYKGIGVSFRPWDHQLRQPLYLVKIDANAHDGVDVESRARLATLVGELPAIYKPGTDPVERLDQIGDLKPESRCRF